MSASVGVPASPRDHRTVTLHFDLPSGDFVGELLVPIGHVVEEDCLGTDVPRRLLAGVPGWRMYVYELVWNGMILEPGMQFEDLVQDHGMSVDEPVDVFVVYWEWHSEYAPKNEGS